MSTPRSALLIAATLFAATTAVSLAETPHLGKPLDEAAIANWDISILPDGTGLPKGSGTPAQGAPIFAEKCAACHGDNGKGGVAAAVVSDRQLNGISASQKTIKNFWPYATTIFDFIRRAMPFTAPRSLSDDEVYALTAYILAGNKLIGADDECGNLAEGEYAEPRQFHHPLSGSHLVSRMRGSRHFAEPRFELRNR